MSELQKKCSKIKSLSPQAAQIIISVITDLMPNVFGIYVFGSQVDNTATDKSDLDLAFLCEQKPTGEDAYQIKSKLSKSLKIDVDLVDLIRADSVTAAQVVTTGIQLMSNSDLRSAHFETMALSRYSLLNEERAEILKDILETGKIHG
jgi:uncharacterized protein